MRNKSIRLLSESTSIFVLALIEGILMPLNPLFSTPTFMNFWRINAKLPKIMLIFTESLRRVLVWPSENGKSGVSDQQKKERRKKKMGITRFG